MNRVLWIINHYVGLPPAPGGVRHLSLGHQLAKLGWDVVIICAATRTRAGDARLGGWPPRHLTEVDSVRAISLDVPRYEGNGLGRVVNMSTFAAAAALPSVTRGLPHPDVVIGSSVHPLAAAVGAEHARRCRVPFIFEIRDLWPETFVRLGVMRESSWAAKCLYALEARLWSRAAMILSPLGQLPAYEEERGLQHRPFLHIPNGVDTGAFDPSTAPHEGPLRLGYFGSHGNTDYLETIVRALVEPALAAKSQEFEVHFFGWGPHKAALRELAHALGARNLTFHEPVSRDELPAAMRSMDAFIFPLGDSKGLYRFGASPNKLQDYMAAGRPIIMNAPFSGDPVTASGGGGILVQECTKESWAAALARFLATPQRERAEMGERVRRLAEADYDFQVLGARLDSSLRGLLGGAR